MARQIIAEEQKEVETVQQTNTEETPQSKDASALVSVLSSVLAKKESEGSTIITSTEMDKLLREFDANGKTDLIVIPDLANRIRKYLDYQKEIDPLKKELAKRIYEPYAVQSKSLEYMVKLDTYVNDIYLGKLQFCAEISLLDGGSFVYVSLCDFKLLLSASRNPYSPWIPNDNSLYVNALAYVLNNGGNFILSDDYNKIEITL